MIVRFFIISIVLYYFIVGGIAFVLGENKLFIDYNSNSRIPNRLVNNRCNGEYMNNFLFCVTKNIVKFLFFLKYCQIQKLFQIYLRRHLYYE